MPRTRNHNLSAVVSDQPAVRASEKSDPRSVMVSSQVDQMTGELGAVVAKEISWAPALGHTDSWLQVAQPLGALLDICKPAWHGCLEEAQHELKMPFAPTLAC